MTLPIALGPLFAQVLLTFAVALGMMWFRTRALTGGEARFRDAAVRSTMKWPTRAQQFGDCYLNLFEAPVLFYVLTILVVVTRQADLLFVILSWIYVLARAVLAYIHTTYNIVQHRGLAYFVSMLVLAILWIVFALRIYLL